MLTTHFYQFLSNLLGGQQTRGSVYVALGSGLPEWDRSLPIYNRRTNSLQNEVVRKLVSSEDIVYVDEQNNPVSEPTTKIRISMNFLAGEGIGSIREAGVFMGRSASSDANAGELVCYYMHPLIEKSDTASLSRQFFINLTPSISSGSQFVTQYLGNSNSREVHNLENQQGSCQIAEISFDRVIYFASLEQAQALGYDACAFCFGRDVSTR